jgi:23S rRNA (pseudouridine1915-N3)-methyltransferase
MSKIAIIQIGKTQEKYLKTGIEVFHKRLNHYCKYEIIELRESSKQNPDEKKSEEAIAIISKLKEGDYLVVLDEHGIEKSSMELAKLVENHFTMNPNRIVFIIGGAFGHGPELLQKANILLSFSKLTFSHQMIRLLLAEQLYRAFTIIKNEKYHNH